MDNILQIVNLTKKYKDFKIDNISFELEKGCIMGFIGQNGAGKTSTIKLILNAIGRSSGEISVLGKDNITDEVFVKSKIGYVPDEDYFIITSTLNGHANALKLFYETWSDEIFQKYIELWELPIDKKLQEFSKGMKTKAMLALALSHQPELLILDEPTAGLDPVARIEVLDILREFVADGQKSVLFSTHITSDLDKVADFITIINRGKVIESLSIDKIEEKYVIVMGALEELVGKEKEFIGIRKGAGSFEGLILREKSNSLFKGFEVHTPNIENMLTFSIWGNRV
jgi:ABC-2 type transport system ATP-binding protein